MQLSDVRAKPTHHPLTISVVIIFGPRVNKLDPETQNQLVALLRDSQVATLAVIVEGSPLTGLVPYAMREDRRVVWIHVSDLAQHTRGLVETGRFSLLIHAPPSQDPLQTVRVSLQGTVEMLEQETDAYVRAKEVYTAKYPQSALLFSFKDFNLFELQILKGRYVAGFAKAYNLSPEGLQALGHMGLDE